MTSRRRCGLTLVELLAALAVTALLATATLAIVSRMGRAHRSAVLADVPDGTHSAAGELLAADVALARRYRNTETGFELQTYASLQRESYEGEHLPVTVSYEVPRPESADRIDADSGRRSVLVRRQVSCPGLAGATRAGLRGLVAVDVDRVRIGKPGKPNRPGASGRRETGEWKALPETVTVRIRRHGAEGETTVVIDRN